MNQHPIVVVGHKNPDTDSICSAIAYANLKSEFLGEAAIPCRAGNINKQTAFVLAEFNIESPRLLTDVYPKIGDIMIGAEHLITLTEDQTLGEAERIITAVLNLAARLALFERSSPGVFRVCRLVLMAGVLLRSIGSSCG